MDDLRASDLPSDAEATNCTFTRLPKSGNGWAMWPKSGRKCGPVVLPAFFYAGTVGWMEKLYEIGLDLKAIHG